MKKDTTGAGTKNWGRHTTQADVIDDGAVTDPAGIEYETKQKEVLALAEEARKLLARGRVDERTAPVPPAPAADASALERKRADVDQALADAAERVRVAGINLKEADKAEVLAKAQREKDRLMLVAEKDRAQDAAAALQRELQQLEAAALAEQTARDHTGPSSDALTIAEWRDQVKEDLAPMVTSAVTTVVKLRELLAVKGTTLDTIAALTPGQHLPTDLWNRYSIIINAALKIKTELVQTIKHTQKVLDRAFAFEPEPPDSYGFSPACHAVQLDLERVSGVVIHSTAFRDPRAFVQITRKMPDVPGIVSEYDNRIASVLEAYLGIQKQVTAATPQPAAKEVIITVASSDTWNRRRQMKKAAALTQSDTRPSHAEGMDTEVV